MFKMFKEILYRSFDVRDLSYKRIKEMLQEDKNSVLIDVRSKQEYAEGHLANSINIPLYEMEFQNDKIPTNKQNTIIVYCASGHRSRQAKEKLEKMGYTNVYSLKNGLDGM